MEGPQPVPMAAFLPGRMKPGAMAAIQRAQQMAALQPTLVLGRGPQEHCCTQGLAKDRNTKQRQGNHEDG